MGGALMQTMTRQQIPNPKEQAFIEVLRQIYEGQFTDAHLIEQRVPASPHDWREIAIGLLESLQKYGQEMYWECYDTMATLYKPLVRWRPLITAPRNQDGMIPLTPRSAAI